MPHHVLKHQSFTCGVCRAKAEWAGMAPPGAPVPADALPKGWDVAVRIFVSKETGVRWVVGIPICSARCADRFVRAPLDVPELVQFQAVVTRDAGGAGVPPVPKVTP